MRFLVDTNLPRALAHWIGSRGHACRHVLDLGLAQTSDPELWRFAIASNETIVSKDQDFADLARGSATGPSVVWLRTGNGTTRDLLVFLAPLWPEIEVRLAAGDRLIEVR